MRGVSYIETDMACSLCASLIKQYVYNFILTHCVDVTCEVMRWTVVTSTVEVMAWLYLC